MTSADRPWGPAHWDAKYAGDELLWSDEANRFVVAEVAKMAPGRALDLACGEGRNAVWLAERGWSVTAVDFSPVGLAKAARLAAARGVGVELVEADACTWPPAPGGYDLVVVAYLQLGPDGRRAALATAAAAVAPGGTLVVVAHHADNLTSVPMALAGRTQQMKTGSGSPGRRRNLLGVREPVPQSDAGASGTPNCCCEHEGQNPSG